MCGCGKQGTTTGAFAPRQAGGNVSVAGAQPETGAASPVPVTVRLTYRGVRALLIRGPASGVGYACYPGDTIAAHQRDVAGLVASGAFMR